MDSQNENSNSNDGKKSAALRNDANNSSPPKITVGELLKLSLNVHESFKFNHHLRQAEDPTILTGIIPKTTEAGVKQIIKPLDNINPAKSVPQYNDDDECDVDLKTRRKKRKHIKNKRKKWRRDILKQNDHDDCDIAEDDWPDVDIDIDDDERKRRRIRRKSAKRLPRIDRPIRGGRLPDIRTTPSVDIDTKLKPNDKLLKRASQWFDDISKHIFNTSKRSISKSSVVIEAIESAIARRAGTAGAAGILGGLGFTALAPIVAAVGVGMAAFDATTAIQSMLPKDAQDAISETLEPVIDATVKSAIGAFDKVGEWSKGTMFEGIGDSIADLVGLDKEQLDTFRKYIRFQEKEQERSEKAADAEKIRDDYNQSRTEGFFQRLINIFAVNNDGASNGVVGSVIGAIPGVNAIKAGISAASMAVEPSKDKTELVEGVVGSVIGAIPGVNAIKAGISAASMAVEPSKDKTELVEGAVSPGIGAKKISSNSKIDDGRTLIKAIAHLDGGAAGYDSWNSGVKPKNGKRVSELTIAEVLQHGDYVVNSKRGSSAAGAYQLMGENVRMMLDKGIVKPTDVFNAETQDKMAMALVKIQVPQVFEWSKQMEQLKQQGKQNTPEYKKLRAKTASALARVWAAIPSPAKGGKSHYNGIAGNRATISMQGFYDLMDTRVGIGLENQIDKTAVNPAQSNQDASNAKTSPNNSIAANAVNPAQSDSVATNVPAANNDVTATSASTKPAAVAQIDKQHASNKNQIATSTANRTTPVGSSVLDKHVDTKESERIDVSAMHQPLDVPKSSQNAPYQAKQISPSNPIGDAGRVQPRLNLGDPEQYNRSSVAKMSGERVGPVQPTPTPGIIQQTVSMVEPLLSGTEIGGLIMAGVDMIDRATSKVDEFKNTMTASAIADSVSKVVSSTVKARDGNRLETIVNTGATTMSGSAVTARNTDSVITRLFDAYFSQAV